MKCINKSHPEFKKLVEETGKNPFVLETIVGIWQSRNNTDRFPTVEELNNKNTTEVSQTTPKLNLNASKQLQQMQQAFPTVKVTEDSSLEASGAFLGKSSDRYKELVKRGEIQQGDPVVVFNPQYMQKDTIYHEFAHVYLDLIFSQDRKRFDTLVDSLRNTDLWNEVRNENPGLSEQMFYKEVVATAIGREGDYQFNESQKGKIRRFWDWVFKRLSRLLGISYNTFKVNAQIKGAFLDMTSKNSNENQGELIREVLGEKTQFQKKEPKKFSMKSVNDHSSKVTLDDGINSDGTQRHIYYFELKDGTKVRIENSVTGKLDSPEQFDDLAIEKAIDKMIGENMIESKKDLEIPEVQETLKKITNDIKQEWDTKAKIGTYLHDRAEKIFKGQDLLDPPSDLFDDNFVDSLETFDEFIYSIRNKVNNNPNLELLSEVRLYDSYNNVAGTIDLLLYDKKKKKLDIIDFKTTNKNYSTSALKQRKAAKQMHAYSIMMKNIFQVEVSDTIIYPVEYTINEDTGKVKNLRELPDRDSIRISLGSTYSGGISAKAIKDYNKFAEEVEEAGVNYDPDLEQVFKEKKIVEIREALDETHKKLILMLDNIPKLRNTSSKKGFEQYTKDKRKRINAVIAKIEKVKKQEDIVNIIHHFRTDILERIYNKIRRNEYDHIKEKYGRDVMLKHIQKDREEIELFSSLKEFQNTILNNTESFDLIDKNGSYSIDGIGEGNFFSMMREGDNIAEKLYDKIEEEIADIIVENTHYGERTFRLTYEAEFYKKNPKGTMTQRNEYIKRKIAENYEEVYEVKRAVIKAKIKTIPKDIRNWKGWLYDPKIIGNNPFIETALQLLDESDYARQDQMRDIEREMTPLLREYFKKNKATIEKANSQTIYKDFLQKDEKGNLLDYLESEYKAEVMIAYKEIGTHDSKAERKAAAKKFYRKYTNTDINGNISIKDEYKNKAFLKKYKNDKEFAALYDKYVELLSTAEKLGQEDMFYGGNKLVNEELGTTFYKIPSVTKSMVQRMMNSGINPKKMYKNAKAELEEFGKTNPDDAEFGNVGDVEYQGSRYQGVKLNVNNQELKNIPILFRGKLGDTREEHLRNQSFDLTTIIMMNTNMAINYKEKHKVESTMNALKIVAENNDTRTRNRGDKQEASRTAIERQEKDIDTKFTKKEKSIETEWYKVFDELIDDRLYGISSRSGSVIKTNLPFLKTIQSHKIVDTLLAYTGKIGMNLNYIANTVNVTNALAQRLIEGVGGRYVNLTGMQKGNTKYWSDIKNIMAEVGHPNKTSKTGLLGYMFDINHQFRGFTDKMHLDSKLQQIVGGGTTLNFLQNAGEHFAQHQLMYAMLDNYKIRNEKGEYIDKEGKVVKEAKNAMTLDEAFDIKMKVKRNGKSIEINKKDYNSSTDSIVKDPYLVLNEKVKQIEGFNIDDVSKLSREEFNNRVLLDIQNKIKDLSFTLDGVYDYKLKSRLQRTALGKLLMIFRKWLFRALNNRYEGIKNFNTKFEDIAEDDIRYNVSLESDVEGYYVSTLRFMIKFVSEFDQYKMNVKARYNSLSKVEQHNIMKALVEFAMIGITLTLGSILYNIGLEADDDDDTKELAFFGATVLRRTYSEFRFYSSITEPYKILRNPTASFSVIDDGQKFIKRSLSRERFKRGDRKGQLKAWDSFKDLIPGFRQFGRSSQDYYEYLISPNAIN